MASETAAERFKAIVIKTVRKIHRTTITDAIEDAVKDLSFIHEGTELKLKEGDPSYELRFEQVINYWNNKTEDLEGKKLSDEKFKEIKSQLLERLENKDYLYVPDSSSLQQSKSAVKCIEKSEQVLAYVTTISTNIIFVKPEDNGDELKVDRKEIPFGNAKLDDFFNPGDEVQVDVCDTGRAKNLTIIKCSECPIECEKLFIITLKKKVLSEDTDAVAIFNDEFERCRGIWNYIKEDKNFLKEDENLKDFLTISAKLAKRLVNRRKTSCKMVLDNVSSSSFFVNYLPDFIEKTVKDLDSNETGEIKTLLNLIAEFCPLAAKRVLKVASSLAKAVVHHAEDVDKTHSHKNYFLGIDFLTNISELLTKSAVPESEEIDLTKAKWYDLPPVLTRTRLYEEPNLQPIKKKGSYNNLEEYLETYHNLLREECYQNLRTGIRNFIENPENHDPKQMNMYRIKLGGVIPTTAGISIMLNYELCGEQENDESSLESKTWLFGSLMCISIDKTFKQLIWATIGQSPKENLKSSNTRNIYVELCSKRNKLTDSDVLLTLNKLTAKGDYALMAESPTFFQAFGPSLESLKEAQSSGNIPFKEEIISCEKSRPPEYTSTHDNNQKCPDWNIIFEKPTEYEFQKPNEKSSPVDAFKFLKEKRVKTKLDPTQLNAIQIFLKNRVTLIQGPPGTGKSFLGGKILQLMLSMEIQKRYKGPILVMTYKNYALDHFMNMCLEFCPNTVRIGKSDKNTLEQVKKINLTQISREKAMRKDLADKYKLTKFEISRLCPKLKKILSNLMKPRFTLDLFLQAAEKRHVDSLLSGPPPGQSEDSRSENCERDDEEKRELKKKLLEWLPKEKLDAKYEAFLERKKVSKTRKSNYKKSSKKEDSEEVSDNEAKELLIKERLQDADESYEGDMSESEDDNNSNNGDVNEPLVFVFERDVGPSLAKLYDVDNVWELSMEDRVDFVYALQGKIMKENIDKFTKQLDKYTECLKDRKHIWDQHLVDILRKYDVIGMTITGAAMRSRILNQIEPCAVIIEEAAEILEGQLISVLPPSIQHLVMLGDQEQLKPAVSCHKLKRYKFLDCSMFERLINNNLDHQQLGKQFRMRDDIAQLLHELNIYKDLGTDPEKTGDNHPPKCIGESMFFCNHAVPEQKALGTSRSNPTEIKMITEVASHLLKYDYSPDHITVLCAYRGQVARMSEKFLEKSKDPEHGSFTKLKDIKITTVDSFQGDENKVILLSLVRSGEGDIGFMKEKNRICVAMSRAKCALYIFGNASHFEEHSRNWKKILEHMRSKKLVGKKLILKEISEKGEQLSSQQPDIQISSDATMIDGDNTVCGDGLDSIKHDDKHAQYVTNTTRLSPREIEMASRKISNQWYSLGGLLNIEQHEMENILHRLDLRKVTEKAVQVLQVYNQRANFTREELGACLKEVNLTELKDEIIKGELRDLKCRLQK